MVNSALGFFKWQSDQDFKIKTKIKQLLSFSLQSLISVVTAFYCFFNEKENVGG